MTHSLTYNLKSRDASASKNWTNMKNKSFSGTCCENLVLDPVWMNSKLEK